MLDEKREYEEYTLPPAPDSPRRLKHCTLGEGGFSGVRRAMTVTARGALFAGGKRVPDAADVERARRALRRWCGFLPEEGEGWLPRYYEQLLLDAGTEQGKSVRGLEEDRKRLLRRDKAGGFPLDAEWSASWGEMLDGSEGGNNRKAVFYDGILADALDAGPLQRRFLVCSGADPFEEVFAGGARIDRRCGGRYFAGDADRILKLAAAFLLGRTNRFQETAQINKRDVTNWTTTNSLAKKTESYALFRYGAENEPLIEDLRRAVFGNACKLRVHPGWLGRYGFAAAGEEELPALREVYRARFGGFAYYADQGGGLPLVRKE